MNKSVTFHQTFPCFLVFPSREMPPEWILVFELDSIAFVFLKLVELLIYSIVVSHSIFMEFKHNIEW